MDETEKKRILIVDDDPTYARMVRDWLMETYQVSVIVNPTQTMHFLSRNAIDLILLDYEMPFLTGPEVHKLLRENPDTADIPVVYLTGMSDEIATQIITLKPAGYILKPSSKESLLSWINSFIL